MKSNCQSIYKGRKHFLHSHSHPADTQSCNNHLTMNNIVSILKYELLTDSFESNWRWEHFKFNLTRDILGLF
jgi:hypothetical protein